MEKDLLFQKCDCTAYLSRVFDGQYIEHFTPDLSQDGRDHWMLHRTCENPDGDLPESECCGEYDIEKTYYKRMEKNFSGIVVGIKDIVTEGYIGVDYEEPPYGGPYYRTFKQPKTTIKCAVVYYASGKRRFVPIDALRPKHTALDDDKEEAIRILNAVNGTGLLYYGDYCDLFDAIEAIGEVK